MDFGFYNMDCMIGMKSLEDNSVKLTLTDIPYDSVNNVRNSERGIRILNKGNADILNFDLTDFLSELFRITSGTIIIFCATGQVSAIYNFFRNLGGGGGITVRHLIWEKTNPLPLNGEKVYLSGIENAVLARKPNATFNAFCKNTVFHYPAGTSKLHPTEKNHKLLAELISDNSNVGDVVFDPCAGSASTLLVANELGRKYIGFELDAAFYKKAKKRLDNETAQMNIFDFM